MFSKQSMEKNRQQEKTEIFDSQKIEKLVRLMHFFPNSKNMKCYR